MILKNRSKIHLGLLVLVAVLVMGIMQSCSKKTIEVPLVSKEIKSDTLSDTYSLQIYLPSNYNSQKEYPLVVLLDANWYMTDVAEWLDESIRKKNVGECILLGINNNDKRNRDFTPWSVSDVSESGGALSYYNFLKYELLPYMSNLYSIKQDQKIIVGHSFGGLFSSYAMLQEPHNPLFQGVLSASPSYYFNNAELFKLTNNLIENKIDVDANFVITVGADEGPTQYALARELYQDFFLNEVNHGRTQFVVYDRKTHVEAAIPAFKDGIQYLLNADYNF